MSGHETPETMTDTLKRALFALQDMRSRLEAAERGQRQPIAMVGMSCRFPGADSPEAFWDLLHGGVDATGEVPAGRWRSAPGGAVRGGFLAEIDAFDAAFFGISAEEAAAMDPQQRLLLEVAWEALERAGMAPDSLAETPTGVFIGITTADYLHLAAPYIDAHRLAGGMPNFAAGRLSHVLGVRGPSMAIDTACSSSLTAIHLACQSLRMGECRVALAGGVNVISDPGSTALVAESGSLSADGRSKTFDARADGMGRGEGCGVVVLKRLSDAVTDGDGILAVIRGSAASHYGKGGGFTVPNPAAQESVIRHALANAGVAPQEVSYLEAHGTGTPFGDLIEMQALGEVFRGGRSERQKLVVGSVKTNIGHGESAAGMAGLFKIVLALEHEEIPRHLHFESPHPEIPWQELPFVVPREPMPWTRGQTPRVAGLSGFGMSGAIAHVVVAEAPARTAARQPKSCPAHILTLSAKSPSGLRAMAERYRRHLEQHPEQSIADICFTANTGRTHFSFRAAMVVESIQDACGKLAEIAGCEPRESWVHRTAVRFTGRAEDPWRQLRELSSELKRPEDGHDRNLDIGPLDPASDEWRKLVEALSELYAAGVDVDWAGFHREVPGALVVLPTYSFQRRRYWFTMMEHQGGCLGSMGHPLTGRRVESPEPEEVMFCAEWSASAPAWMSDHKVYGAVVVSGTSYFETALSGAVEAWGPAAWYLEDVMVHEPLVLDDDTPREVRLVLRRGQDDGSFEIRSRSSQGSAEDRWTVHADGRIGVRAGTMPVCGSLARAQAACRSEIVAEEYYRVLGELGLDYGPSFRNIRRLWRGDGEALGLLEPSAAAKLGAWSYFHPGILDACCQVVGAAAGDFFEPRDQACVTIGFEALRVFGPMNTRLWCSASVKRLDDGATLAADLHIFGEGGGLVAEVAGICFKRVSSDIVRRAVGRPKAPAAPLYRVEWRLRAAPAKPAAVSGHFLILADRGGVGARLAGWLEQQGANCGMVFPGASAAELEQTVKQFLDESGEAPGNVVYLWGLEATPGSHETSFEFTVGSLLGVTQALEPAERTVLPRLWIVTRHAQSVTPGPVAIEQSPLWGFPRGIAMEHADLRCRLVDLDGASPESDAGDLLRELAATDGEDRVAIRKGERYAARLAPFAAQDDGGARRLFAGNGTYLITGGLGALGLLTARWLVGQGARDVALLGRRPPSAEAAQVIAGMEAQGARIRVLAADVSERESLAAALETLPLLRGVIHSAGALSDALLEQQSWERFRTVFASKVTGAWNLHSLTAGRNLDCFVLFSSGASLLGSPAQTNYCSANAFLDGLAHHRRALGLPALSINWGPWKDIGMAAGPGNERRWRKGGVSLITPQQGVEALEVLMRQNAPQVAVLPIDWGLLLDRIPGLESPFFSELVKSMEPGPAPQPQTGGEKSLLAALAAAPAANSREMVFDFVRGEVLRMLGRDRSSYVDERQPLSELGFDSLMAVEIKNVLSQAVGRTLSAGMVYLYPNIRALAEYMASDVLKLAEAPAAEPLRPPGRTQPDLLEEVEQLSEKELNERLAEFAGMELRAEEFWTGSHE